MESGKDSCSSDAHLQSSKTSSSYLDPELYIFCQNIWILYLVAQSLLSVIDTVPVIEQSCHIASADL